MTAKLDRGMGVLHATATNMLAMIGVGPFLTIPLMVKATGGPHILYAWLIGAVLALCDGLVYAHFGAALPGSGGPYLYLREAYQPFGLGRFAAFLFIFQTLLVAPLSIASGAVGFSDYLGFYWSMGRVPHDCIAAALCVLMTALLYRRIESVGKLSVVMLAIVLVTVGWVILGGLFKFSLAQAFAFPPEARRPSLDLLAKTGPVALLAMYNYGGYNTACYLGEEVQRPERTLPFATVLSIALVVVLYVVMSTVVLGTVPWTEVQSSTTVASLFIERTFTDPAAGRVAARVMTGLILVVTASALYASILGLSRVPYAAARDGQFFRVFARVHPTQHFPHVSLLAIGAASIPFCFLSFGKLVSWLILVQIAMQFVWQCAGVVLLKRYRADVAQPFVMWLYPIPAIVAFVMWVSVFVSSDSAGIAFSLAFLGAAVAAYALFVKRRPSQ